MSGSAGQVVVRSETAAFLEGGVAIMLATRDDEMQPGRRWGSRVEPRHMERKISVGDALGEVFSIYGAQAGVLLPVAFCIFLAVGIINGLLVGSLILFALVIVVDVVAATIYQGMVVGLVRDVQDGRRDMTVGELLDATTPVIATLIGAGILSGLGVGIGMILLVVPGLILITIWAVIAPVIVIERAGVIEAFGRSRELVRGNGWQVFGVVVCAFLIALVVGFVFSLIGAAIVHGALGRILFGIVSSTITAPITALTAAVLYYRLVAIEGGAPAAPAAEPVEAPPPAEPPVV